MSDVLCTFEDGIVTIVTNEAPAHLRRWWHMKPFASVESSLPLSALRRNIEPWRQINVWLARDGGWDVAKVATMVEQVERLTRERDAWKSLAKARGARMQDFDGDHDRTRDAVTALRALWIDPYAD